MSQVEETSPTADVSDAKTAIPPAKRSRPNKTIPTERIKLERQFDLLRAFAGVYSATGKPVSNKEVADIVQMSDTTTSLANGFFTETGLLSKAAGGWVPADEVVAYHRSYEWDRDAAARELQPVLARCWFWEVLQPKLGFRPMDEKDAINALGAAAAASADYRPNLKLIIDYLVSTGMIERDGAMLKIIRTDKPREETPPSQPPQERVRQNTSTVNTGFNQHPGGGVQFHVNINVSMEELGSWKPERIAAFFAGMAKVLAAKSGLEQEVAE
jgi:hypothetical protein